MRTKKFLASTNSPNTVRVFDANSRQLYRIIPVNGTIMEQPQISDSILNVTVQIENINYRQQYALPNGNLINSVQV